MTDPCKPSRRRFAAEPRNPEKFRKIDRLFRDALARNLFSAASVLVTKAGTVCYESVFGTCYHRGPAVDRHTWFDIASLTKPLATASLLIHLVSTGAIDPDDPLARFFPPELLPAAKKDIRLHHLLSHRSGLPAHRPYYRRLISYPQDRRKEIACRWILDEPLLERPGRQGLYSDLGFILLGRIVEQVMADDLDLLFSRTFGWEPSVTEITYLRLPRVATDPARPGPPPSGLPRRVAATEQCPWRKRLLIGEVHDHNAYCLQAVAGHAGLFATARGIEGRLAFLLDVLKKRIHPPGWSPAVIEHFWQRPQGPASSKSSGWVLGFDTPSLAGSAAGSRFSPDTVGHLGFTGTSFWLDWQQEIIIILLTNSIYPHRHEAGLNRFRPLVHDLIMEKIDD